MFLVMEFCSGGDLAHYIRRCGRVPEPVAHGLMRQLAAGLREMRALNLVHVSARRPCSPSRPAHGGTPPPQLTRSFGAAGHCRLATHARGGVLER